MNRGLSPRRIFRLPRPPMARWLHVASLVLGGAGAVACSQGGAGSAPRASASATAAPAPASTQITLRPLPARIGDKTKGVRKSSMKMSVEFWQEDNKVGSNESSRTEAYARTVEVLGLLGGAPAKVRAHYDRYHLSERPWDKPAHEDGRFEGQTYLLDATDGKTKVATAEGQAKEGEEGLTLQKLHGELGADDPLVVAIGSRPIRIGHTVPLRETMFRALVNIPTGELKQGKITLSGTRPLFGKEAAVFDWTAEMQSREDNGLELTWHLKGQAVVATAPAATLQTTVDGSIDVGGKMNKGGVPMRIVGEGSITDDRSITPL